MAIDFKEDIEYTDSVSRLIVENKITKKCHARFQV
jgi:hypothetical protein